MRLDVSQKTEGQGPTSMWSRDRQPPANYVPKNVRWEHSTSNQLMMYAKARQMQQFPPAMQIPEPIEDQL